MDRLTTDTPETNLQALLNFAYAKDQRVVLAYADDKNDHDLCEYVANFALRNGCIFTPEEVMDGACSECDCHIAVMKNTAIQAAELRGRLKRIEDILGDTYDLDHLRELMEADQEGRLVIMPSPAKEGDPKPSCFFNDNGGIWCNGMAPVDGDEPTERCKQCWYCEFGYDALKEE